MSDYIPRPLEVGDYVSKIWEPGVFWEVIGIEAAPEGESDFAGIVTIRRDGKMAKLPRRHVMRAVPANGVNN